MKNIFLPAFRRFVKTESLAGILLLITTIVALVWANSSYSAYYEYLRQLKIGFSIRNFELIKPLILWINDGLMAIFFFLIGLELKRELLIGEINTVKKAVFPFVAALGGVLIPIVIYLTLNRNPETVKGWGIPMATDIAFALAILNALGKKVPLSLKIFLTAFAIIDDIAAVLVIAVFYSTNIHWLLVAYGLVIIAFLGFFYSKKGYSFPTGIILAVVAWFLFLKSGIHPTIAGVLLAFTIPIKGRLNVKSFSEKISLISQKIKALPSGGKEFLLNKEELEQIDALDSLSFEVRSPLQHLENKLHGLIAYFVLPVFALSNAGVVINAGYNFDFTLMFNIAVSLFVGKFAGVALFSYLGIKTGLTELPFSVNFKQILGIAFIAGIGFTMSIFIANLAFKGNLIGINSAKVGIIIGSIVSGIVGYLILRLSSANYEK